MWSPLFDMSLFPNRTANTNTGEWSDERWTEGLRRLEQIRDPQQERAELRRMEAVFREDAPWLFLYFQPDFYAASTRIAFTPRPDERIDVMAIRPAPALPVQARAR